VCRHGNVSALPIGCGCFDWGVGCMAGGIALGAVHMSAQYDYFTLSAGLIGQ